MSFAKHLLRYLNTYPDRAIALSGYPSSYDASFGPPGLSLLGASNAAFADDRNTRVSTFGYIFMAAGGLVSFRSSKQGLVATSSTKAEYIAMTYAAKEAIWIKGLL